MQRNNLMSFSEHIAFQAIQGVVNRKNCRLYLLGDSYAYTLTDTTWMEYYRKEKIFNFIEVKALLEIAEIFKDDFKGIITYDNFFSGNSELTKTLVEIAAVIAGIADMMPVIVDNAEMFSKNTGMEIMDEVTLDNGKTRKVITGRLETLPIDTMLEGYNWQFENLVEYANQSEYMMQTSGCIDYAVYKKMLYFDLKTFSNLDDFEFEKKIQLYFAEKNDCFHLWGWVENEYHGVHNLSKNGGVMHNIACGNLSFHSMVPANITSFSQVGAETRDMDIDLNKFYIAFFASESDTAKAPLSFNHGGYLSQNRGDVAINWGMAANTLLHFPAIAEYYQSTATENDYFYTSGGCYEGYVDFPVTPQKTKNKIIEVNKYLSKLTDQPYLDYFAFPFHEINKREYAIMAEKTELMGLIGRSTNDRTEIAHWGNVLAVDRYYSYINHSPALSDKRTYLGEFEEKNGIIRGIEDENLFTCYVSYDYLSIRGNVIYKDDKNGVVSLRGFISSERDTYYEARIEDGNYVELVSFVCGNEQLLSRVKIEIESGKTYDIRMFLDGESIKVSFGEWRGKLTYIINVKNNNITKGTYGYYTTNKSVLLTTFECSPMPGWKEVYNNILRETVNTDKNGGICTGFYGVIVNEDVTTSQFQVETPCGAWILINPQQIKMIMENLEKKYPDKFEAVTLDKFMKAASIFEKHGQNKGGSIELDL